MPIMHTWKSAEEIRERMDPEYWDDDRGALRALEDSGFPESTLAPFITGLAHGYRGRAEYVSSSSLRCIRARDITRLGVDFATCGFVAEGGPMDSPNRRIDQGDIILIRTGVGSLGRCVAFASNIASGCISGDVMAIRVDGVNPFYVCVYLSTRYGKGQLQRHSTGASGLIHISNDGVRAIRLPLVPEQTQNQVETRYRHMSEVHEAAMAAREAGEHEAFKSKLEYAEQLLDDLIAYVEQVIQAGPDCKKEGEDGG